MKKLLFLGLVVIAGVAAATYYPAYQLQLQQQAFEAHLDSSSSVMYFENQTSYGFLSAKGKYVIALSNQAGDEAVIQAPWQAHFYPGRVELASQIGISISENGTVIQLDELLGIESFDIQGQADWNSVYLNYEQKLLESTMVPYAFTLSGLEVWTEVYYSGVVESGVRFDDFKTLNPRSGLVQVQEFSLQGLQQGELPWLSTSWETSLAKFELIKGVDRTEYANAKWQFSYQLTPEELVINNDVSVGQSVMSQAGMNLMVASDSDFSMAVSQINGHAFVQFSTALLEQGKRFMDGEAIDVEDNQVRLALDKVMETTPKLELKNWSVNLLDPVPMAPQAKGWATLGNSVPEDLSELQDQLEVELTFSNLPDELLILLGVTPQTKSPTGEYQFKIEGGIVFLNGVFFAKL